MTTPPDALTKGCERLASGILGGHIDEYGNIIQGPDSVAHCLATDPGLAGLVELAKDCAGYDDRRGSLALAALRRFTDG